MYVSNVVNMLQISLLFWTRQREKIAKEWTGVGNNSGDHFWLHYRTLCSSHALKSVYNLSIQTKQQKIKEEY